MRISQILWIVKGYSSKPDSSRDKAIDSLLSRGDPYSLSRSSSSRLSEGRTFCHGRRRTPAAGLRETEPYLSWRSPPGFSSSLPATQPGKGPRPWRPRGPPKATRSPASGAPPARLSFPKPPCSPSRSSCHTIPHRHILTPEPRMSCSCCCMCVCVCVASTPPEVKSRASARR